MLFLRQGRIAKGAVSCILHYDSSPYLGRQAACERPCEDQGEGTLFAAQRTTGLDSNILVDENAFFGQDDSVASRCLFRAVQSENVKYLFCFIDVSADCISLSLKISKMRRHHQ